MKKNIFHRQNWRELAAYGALWLILFLLPIFTEWVNARITPDKIFHWDGVFHLWLSILNLFIVFVIHNFFIAPIFVYHRKRWIYYPLAIALIGLYMSLIYTYRPELPPPPPKNQSQTEMQAVSPLEIPSNGVNDIAGPPPLDRHDIIAFTLALLVFGVNLGVKQYFKSQADRERLEELEKENITQQLDYLRYQVNPHFFMNTLNNIHALVDIAPDKAKETIVMLSKMMRYILYDGAKQQIPLQHEIDFLNNYIALMRLRFNDKVEVVADLPDNAGDLSLPPLLFIMYVENAFKHGVSYANQSFVKVSLQADEERNRLLFKCTNSIAHNNAPANEPGGVGLDNARKRLDLIYGEDYSLETLSDDDTYRVTLDIPLNTANATLTPSNQQPYEN